MGYTENTKSQYTHNDTTITPAVLSVKNMFCLNNLNNCLAIKINLS